MPTTARARDLGQYEQLLDANDSDDETPHTSAADRRDVAAALPLRRTPWLRRADALCLAIMCAVSCYVAIWQPAVRLENPLLLVNQHQQPLEQRTTTTPTTVTGTIPAFQYMTYDDILPQQRRDGYTVKATARGFEIDGRLTLLLGGSIHYARSSQRMWHDVLLKAKHDGLNHIQMYLFWNLHEPERGVWDFNGDKNVTHFFELAAHFGLFVHLRVGPYVCAEYNNGGLPLWLNTIPNMRVRSSNALWEAEMTRYVTHVMEIAQPYLASKGGPIVLAQIENEFTATDDPAYVAYCGALVERLNTSIPWVMCNGEAANNTIRACNGDDCVAFALNQTTDRPLEPLVWTENEGWYEMWERKPIDDATRMQENDQRTAADVAYAVARWFAVGGAAQNYYMYHGGNNYGRAAAAGVTTMYADGVNLHADSLSNEPKRSHLRLLHKALRAVNDKLLASPRQLLYPQPLGTSNTLRLDAQASTLEQLTQRAFVYGKGDADQVGFLENTAVATGVNVAFAGALYYLAPQSLVLVNGTGATARVLFNTSNVAASFSHKQQHRVYTAVVDARTLYWQTWHEPIGVHRRFPRKALKRMAPLEQLTVTRDRTDYLTYETHVRLHLPAANATNDTALLTITTCDANSFTVFLNGRFVAAQHFGFPGHNCSKHLTFRLPVHQTHRHDRLTLVSGSLGISSLGQNHRKGITGAVMIGNLDLAAPWSHQWTMLPGLVGEQLELYDPEWTHSVDWTHVLPINSSQHFDRRPHYPLLAWYMTSFYLEESANPFQSQDDEDVPIEQVSSMLLDLIGLTRGRAYVNGHDIGRYWLLQKDDANDNDDTFVQRYYHVPSDWLHFGNATANVVVVFDELGGSIANVRLVLSTIVESPSVLSTPSSAALPSVVGLERGHELGVSGVVQIQ